MKVRTRLFITVLLAVVTLFIAGTALAESGPRCEKVNAHLSDYVDFSDTPACVDAGYVFCVEIRSVGTINGRLLALDRGGDWIYDFPEFGDTVAWRAPIIFETKHGEIWTDAVGMQFQAVFQELGRGRVQQTCLITGGTGRYEDATGVILTSWAGPGIVVGEVWGEICWPED